MSAIPKPAPRCRHSWRRVSDRLASRYWDWCQFCGKKKNERTWDNKPVRRKPIARGAPPRKVSAKRKPQLREYSATFRGKIIGRDGGCVVGRIDVDLCVRLTPTPSDQVVEVEHVNGRRGRHLLDEWGAVALHRGCHQWVTNHAKEWKPKLRGYLAALKRGAECSDSAKT